MVTARYLSLVITVATVGACRSGSAPTPGDTAPVPDAAKVVAQNGAALPVEEEQMFGQGFQFTIDGMRRINGAL